jgi:DNA-3-methyladenine glycosylase II
VKLKHKPDVALNHLVKVDPIFARLVKHFGRDHGIGVNKTHAPYFHVLILSVINQQLSVKAAQTIGNRLLLRQGGRHFNAQKLSKLEEADMRLCGVSRPKMRYIAGLCEAVLSDQLNFRRLVRQDDDTVRDCLTQFHGIGTWSADMFLMQAMGRPDVLPLGDLILRKSMQKHYGIGEKADITEYWQVADAWRPYRSTACRYLWAGI